VCIFWIFFADKSAIIDSRWLKNSKHKVKPVANRCDCCTWLHINSWISHICDIREHQNHRNFSFYPERKILTWKIISLSIIWNFQKRVPNRRLKPHNMMKIVWQYQFEFFTAFLISFKIQAMIPVCLEVGKLQRLRKRERERERASCSLLRRW